MNVVFTVQQILLGHTIYNDPGAAPYAITQYTPLYYYLAALPLIVAKVRAADVLTVAAVTRAVSLTIAALLALICAGILRHRLGATKTVTLVATVFIVCGTANWYFAVRPDGLATLLTLASFYLVTRDAAARDALAAASVCAVAAIFAKQTGIFSAVVIVAFLASRSQWKDLVFSILTMIAAFLIGLTLMSLTGPAIKANIIDGINNGIALRPALMLAYRPAFYWFAPLFALAFAALPRLFRESESPASQLLAVAIPISFVMSTLAALKRGSAENYFNELLILSVFAFVAAYVQPSRRNRLSVDKLAVTAMQVYIVSVLLIRAGHQVYVTYLYHRSSPETRLTSQIPAVDYVRRNIGPDRYAIGFAVGLSNAFPEQMIFPEKALADAAQKRKLVDYSRFGADVMSGKVQYVIAPKGEHLKPFLNVSLDRFKPVRQFSLYTVYRLN
jgi:hypothetical protein